MICQITLFSKEFIIARETRIHCKRFRNEISFILDYTVSFIWDKVFFSRKTKLIIACNQHFSQFGVFTKFQHLIFTKCVNKK